MKRERHIVVDGAVNVERFLCGRSAIGVKVSVEVSEDGGGSVVNLCRSALRIHVTRIGRVRFHARVVGPHTWICNCQYRPPIQDHRNFQLL